MTTTRTYLKDDQPQLVQGLMLEVGQQAPDFELIANDFSPVTLASSAGKARLISVVPSLDTRICDAQTRRFNEEAATSGNDVLILTVSADLPFAQRRWCGNAGVEHTQTLSCHRDMKFADDYGVHLLEHRLCQRAIFVIDADDTLRYIEYVEQSGAHVDYDAALAAFGALVG